LNNCNKKGERRVGVLGARGHGRPRQGGVCAARAQAPVHGHVPGEDGGQV